VNRRKREIMDLMLCLAKHFAATSLRVPAPFLGGAALFVQSDLNRKQSRRMEELLCEILERRTSRRRTK
jgi:hypothetical protein